MSRRRLAILASLAGLSALVVAMVVVRVVYTGNDYFTNLVWNLFLAWIPLGLAVYAYDGYRKGQGRFRLWAAGGLWLLFFPNALYIVTDFKWSTNGPGHRSGTTSCSSLQRPGAGSCSGSLRST